VDGAQFYGKHYAFLYKDTRLLYKLKDLLAQEGAYRISLLEDASGFKELVAVQCIQTDTVQATVAARSKASLPVCMVIQQKCYFPV
jgi:hypothetical protein